jgi:hypothetical protein
MLVDVYSADISEIRRTLDPKWLLGCNSTPPALPNGPSPWRWVEFDVGNQ